MASKILVESSRGVGSNFWFDLDLPVFLSINLTNIRLQNKIIGYTGKIRKILVVDDYWENPDVIIKKPESIGFELPEAVTEQVGL